MRAVVTRVSEANVKIEGKTVGQIGKGFLVLLGVGEGDTEENAKHLAEKIAHLRVFSDKNGKMNLALKDVEGELLIVSQFTLYADLKSRRPGFTKAAKAELAEELYEKFSAYCKEFGFKVERGEFGADMQVSSVNDGPVTLIFDTDEV
ncbi:MAG: D-tyrosyl-tRNA(Tyr) deacylase [Selenomonadaceae bacterium]|nr:D-tyrosyl-tRNA(Tyr) deacylase [Selenomonadaceae bacterium]